MKRIIFTLIILSSITFYQLQAQVIEDFEAPNLMRMSPNPKIDSSSFVLVDNPFPNEVNPSKIVLKFTRKKDYSGWSGIYYPTQPFYYEKDMYFHVKIWKPRISPIILQLYSLFIYRIPNGSEAQGIYWDPIQPQKSVNNWEEVVFSFNPYNFLMRSFLFVPEDAPSEGLKEDVVMYIDDITINHDPTVGSAPEFVFTDFEHNPLYLMLGDNEDNSSMIDSPNPDISGANLSAQVIKFTRDKDGVPWGGFWSTLKSPIDVTNNKYMHVKVWKPRISPVKFKIEGGAAGNLEVESIYPQTKTNEWEDMVFDLSSKTGTYPTIAFMPDFENPVTLTKDIVIFFDDIELNNDPLPRDASEIRINVDMKHSGIIKGSRVFITGNFVDKFADWSDVSVIPENEMTDPDGDGIFSITKKIPDGPVSFQFYYITGTGRIEGDFGLSERKFVLDGDTVLNCKWQVGGAIADTEEPKIQIFNVDMKEAGKTTGQKVYISGNFGGINGNWAEPGTNVKNEMFDTDGDGIFSITMNLPDGNYQFKFFKGEGWGGGEWIGDPNRSFNLVGSKNIICKWGYPAVKLNMISCNLITDGNFDSDGLMLGDWIEFNNDYIFPSVNVNDGVLTLTNNNVGEFWETGVFQQLNDYGKLLFNDTTYLLIFDAWASKDRICSFDLEDNWVNSYRRFGISSDFDALNGESQWDINLTANRTTYSRTVTMKKILPNTSFFFRIMAGAATGSVYVDNLYLLSQSDFKNYGVPVTGIKINGEGNVTEIASEKGTLQMYATIFPLDSWMESIRWSVLNQSGYASINQSGLLSAITNGTVKVIATTLDGTNISDSLEITISNQKAKPDLPIDFENISDLAWNVMNNSNNASWQFSLAPNPYKTRVNPSENVLRFNVTQQAGVSASISSTAFGPFSFNCANNIVYMSIRKHVKTVVGIKLEQSTDGGPDTMITATSNAVDVWQKLKFDFSACAGHTYQKMTIYPDVYATIKEGAVFYIDDILFPCLEVNGIPAIRNNLVNIYPNPVNDILNVLLNSANTKLTIYNSLGSKIVEKFAYENIVRIDVRNYAPGVYILKTGDGAVVKFIK